MQGLAGRGRDVSRGPERVRQLTHYPLALGPLHQLTPPLTSASKWSPARTS